MNFPDFDWYPAENKAILAERYSYQTAIRDTVGAVSHCLLSRDGVLALSPGFVWDFASGAVDDPAMVYASLAHDSLYRLIREGELDKKHRVDADKLFRELLKECGVGVFRRNYAYLAVRLLGGFHTKASK